MMRGGLGGHGENYVSPIERSISRLTIST
jgi:hypothetical protein